MPTLKERFGLTGAVISAVDLIRGIGKYAGLKPILVPGATGFLDTNYAGKVAAALAPSRKWTWSSSTWRPRMKRATAAN